jgi:hypothetical protein
VAVAHAAGRGQIEVLMEKINLDAGMLNFTMWSLENNAVLAATEGHQVEPVLAEVYDRNELRHFVLLTLNQAAESGNADAKKTVVKCSRKDLVRG